MSEGPARRMTRAQRREQMVTAATAVVAERGFAGTSTDDVARAAGVSQPYVVQVFGGRAGLMAAVFEQASGRILEVFERVPAGPGAKLAMSRAYMELIADGDLLRVLLHGLCSGTDPVLGPRARAVLADTFRVFQERTGASTQEARDFVAHGMLVNVLLVAEAPAHLAEDPVLEELARATVGEDLLRVPGSADRVRERTQAGARRPRATTDGRACAGS